MPVQFLETIEEALSSVESYEKFLTEQLEEDFIAMKGQQSENDKFERTIADMKEKLQKQKDQLQTVHALHLNSQ